VAFALFLLLISATGFSAETGLSQQTLADINLARKNPPFYANFLREFREKYPQLKHLVILSPQTTTPVKGVSHLTYQPIGLHLRVRYTFNC
jgi:hypothetical protein